MYFSVLHKNVTYIGYFHDDNCHCKETKDNFFVTKLISASISVKVRTENNFFGDYLLLWKIWKKLQ